MDENKQTNESLFFQQVCLQGVKITNKWSRFQESHQRKEGQFVNGRDVQTTNRKKKKILTIGITTLTK